MVRSMTAPAAAAFAAFIALALACDGTGRSSGRTTDCTAAECGPRPLAPNYLCVDGRTGGPGPCERSAAGTCGWTFVTCEPIRPCPLESCARSGAPQVTCSDGSAGGPLGICMLDAQDRCVEVVRTCP
jgi:hypothetical protein